MEIKGYDFSGWASKNDLRCEDGVTIKKDAFAINNGKRVPLVWNHEHNSIAHTLGYAILENRDEGIYAYGFFNDTENGKNAREVVKHGDVESLSIWANNIKKVGNDVVHGIIREVSLVLAGANPGAFIESVIAHGMMYNGDEEEDEFILHCGESLMLNGGEEENILSHASKEDDKEEEKEKDDKNNAKSSDKKKDSESDNGEDDEEDINLEDMDLDELYDSLTKEQKDAVSFIIADILEKEEKSQNDNKEGEEEMKHNIFDASTANQVNVISHSDMETIFKDAKRLGSLRESVNHHQEDGVLAHSIDTTGMTVDDVTQDYGIGNIGSLYPEYKTLQLPPEFISREMTWVQKVLRDVGRTPFSRIKTIYADITEDEARAKGYIKGNQKKEEVFTTLKRTTDPQTIYKKQKLDRDDIIDITDFDVVKWIKSEMEVMLDEEKARAILIGDGRLSDSEDKIQESHIRPVVSDVPLFNIMVPVEVEADADSEAIAKATINAVIRARKDYKGSGNPTFWTTEDVVTEMLLIEDAIGHKIYKSEAELATTLRAKELVPVEPMEGMTIEVDGTDYPLIGTLVNLTDYKVGADKGGEKELFDDFDIDYNQYKYLIETRMSGALVKPFSAMTFYLVQS